MIGGLIAVILDQRPRLLLAASPRPVHPQGRVEASRRSLRPRGNSEPRSSRPPRQHADAPQGRQSRPPGRRLRMGERRRDRERATPQGRLVRRTPRVRPLPRLPGARSSSPGARSRRRRRAGGGRACFARSSRRPRRIARPYAISRRTRSAPSTCASRGRVSRSRPSMSGRSPAPRGRTEKAERDRLAALWPRNRRSTRRNRQSSRKLVEKARRADPRAALGLGRREGAPAARHLPRLSREHPLLVRARLDLREPPRSASSGTTRGRRTPKAASSPPSSAR